MLSMKQEPGEGAEVIAEDQPRLIQGIRRGDGVGDYLYAN